MTWLFFGEGLTVKAGDEHPHNNCIGILKHMGLIGIIFWFVYYKKVFIRSFWLIKNDPIYDMSNTFRGILWAYIWYFVFFLTCTPIQWPAVRYVDFCLMTLLCLRCKQIETEAEYAFEDELYPAQ
jgi:O-antigen ligase